MSTGASTITIVIITAAVCSVVGGVVASAKGRRGEGAIYGLLLGPFGCIVAALLEPSRAVQKQRNLDLAEAIAKTAPGGAAAPAIGAASARTLRTCPSCAERVQPSARRCRYCTTPLAPVPDQVLAWHVTPDEAVRLADVHGATFGAVVSEVAATEGADESTVDAPLLDDLCRAVAEGRAATIDLRQLFADRGAAARDAQAIQDDRFNRFWTEGESGRSDRARNVTTSPST